MTSERSASFEVFVFVAQSTALADGISNNAAASKHRVLDRVLPI
jgi:hypothetical protein